MYMNIIARVTLAIIMFKSVPIRITLLRTVLVINKTFYYGGDLIESTISFPIIRLFFSQIICKNLKNTSNINQLTCYLS